MSATRERGLMLWFYTRDGASVRVETRYDHHSREYFGTLTDAEGREHTRRFRSAPALRDWLVSEDTRLLEARWTQEGPPHVLTDGAAQGSDG